MLERAIAETSRKRIYEMHRRLSALRDGFSENKLEQYYFMRLREWLDHSFDIYSRVFPSLLSERQSGVDKIFDCHTHCLRADSLERPWDNFQKSADYTWWINPSTQTRNRNQAFEIVQNLDPTLQFRWHHFFAGDVSIQRYECLSSYYDYQQSPTISYNEESGVCKKRDYQSWESEPRTDFRDDTFTQRA